jgi:hypothetical protein
MPDSLRTIIHGQKVKADKEHSLAVCRGLLIQVKALTGVLGVVEYQFDPERRWRFDCCWKEQKIALELNGWNSHHRRGRMEQDNIKLASAVLAGWRVFYATKKQVETQAALWVAHLIKP